MKREMVRQGDILLIPVGKQTVKKEEAKETCVLAYGEATGHNHRVVHPGAMLFATKENLRILRLEEEAELVHEEHAPIRLPSGDYQVIQQRENTALGWRPVVD